MSDDLVKRLRDARRDWPEYGMDRTDAADELERLRAENARLRELVSRANDLISGDLVGWRWERACHEFCRDARAALQNEGGE